MSQEILDRNNNPIRILFMDDLFDDHNDVLLTDAVKRLTEKGFEVYKVKTKSEAIDAFYNCFYKVFILDIDMSHTKDELEGRGTIVAELFRALDNQTRVIMYSAMGTAEDLFLVVNYHVYAYVTKNAPQPVDTLVAIVEKAAYEPMISHLIPEAKKSGTILISNNVSAFETNRLDLALKKYGDFRLESVSLRDLPNSLSKMKDCVAIFLGNTSFNTHPSEMELIEKICSFQPKPHVVIGCNCENQYFNSLVALANLHPFRLVAANSVDATEAAAKAIADASFWYGANETFKADLKYVHRAAAEIDWSSLKREIEGLDIPFSDNHTTIDEDED